MTMEIDWQAKIVKRLKAEGRYARKASSTYAVGVLDLDVIIREVGNVKIEVKLDHGLKSGWSRKIAYTAKQKEEAENVIAAGGQALGLHIQHYSPTEVYLYFHRMPSVQDTLTLTEEETKHRRVRWKKGERVHFVSIAIIDEIIRQRKENGRGSD